MSDSRHLAAVSRDFSNLSRLSVGRAKASSKTAKELFEKAECDLAKRMLMQHALLDGTKLRSRFVTDVLCQQDLEWAALPFAEHGVTDPDAAWQARRRQVVERATRPTGTYEEPSTYIFSETPDRLRIRLSGGEFDEYLLQGEDFPREILEIFETRGLKFCNETLVFDLDSISGAVFDRVCEEVFASSALWPVNIVALGRSCQITKAFEVDKRRPENTYWFLKEEGQLVFLGIGNQAGHLQALPGRLSLEDAILGIHLIRAGKLLDLVKDPATQDKLARELLEELAVPAARLTRLPATRVIKELAGTNRDALVDRIEENV